MKSIELPVIRESTEDYDKIQEEILRIFRKEIYLPLLKELQAGSKTLKNDLGDKLAEALLSGRVRYSRGQFKGRFSSSLTKELRSFGAVRGPTQGSWKVPQSNLPEHIRQAISVSESKMKETTQRIDSRLAKVLPAEITKLMRIDRLFERTLWKTNGEINKTLKGITVGAQLTPDQNKLIAAEYTENLNRYIQDFTEKEIISLREQVRKSLFAGNRYETLVGTIQTSYSTSESKAKFLARQETGLMMAAFKQARYQDAGSRTYIWTTVKGSPKHPVRPMHKALDGKEFSWDNPPVTDEKGNRNHPGQDYNCRCTPRPIVKFQG